MTYKDGEKAHNLSTETNISAQHDKHRLTIEDLSWTQEQAAQLRAQFAVFAEDWDDANMDVYNDL